MVIPKLLTRIPIFPLMAVTSFFVGRSIPAFYEWTGSEQSGPSPLVSQTALGLLLFVIFICIALPWLPIAKDPPTVVGHGKFQFKLRSILIVTALAAAILAFYPIFPVATLLVLGNGFFVFALAISVRSWIAFRLVRWRMFALFACMYFPFAWLVNFDEVSHLSYDFLWMAIGLPALIPTLLAGSVVQQHPEGLTWLSSMFAGLELVVGLWVIRQGPRRAIAYILFVLILSMFGSFILNALFRM